MKNFTLLFLMLIASLGFAQKTPITFETDGHGAGWTWTVFENGTNPALEIIPNPDATGTNTSTTVAKFTALQAGQPYAGVESAHGDADLGPFVLDATNSVIKIMVWKSVISDVGIKLVAASGWAQPEIKVANTVVNQWEELTFNFSGTPNPPGAEGQYDQIVVFPDFNTGGRTQDNVIYFDNITFSAADAGEAPAAPAGLVASNMIGENPVGTGELFLACGPNQVGGDVVYKLFYSKTAETPADPKTATEYVFGSTAGDGDGTNAFGFVLPGLDPGTEYSFWLYQYNTSSSLYSASAATASAVSGGEGTTTEGPNAPIDFETDGYGAAWTWSVFENATNPPLEIIPNPDASGINTSTTVAKFTALQAGNPWAGVESAHGNDDLGPFVLDATNSVIKIMVWKPVISNVGIKLVASNGWAQPEIKVANTVVNQWEELTFDFSGIPNPPSEAGQYDQIAVFPDFNTDGRTQDNVIYFDNITFSAAEGGVAPAVPAGLVASNTIGENPVGTGELFLACGPNQVGGDVVYKLFYSKTSEAPSDPKTATEYIFGSTGGDGDGINAFGFVLPGLDPGTEYSFWLYQYNTSSSLYSDGAATASAVSGGEGTTTEGPNAPIDFETDGYGADWTWSVFENATNPPLEIIPNPDAVGINTSTTVAKYTALQAGNPWAGVESAHGDDDLGPFVLDATNSVIKVMVWKPVISNVGVKLIASNGWAQPEIKVANTVVNQWEELTFDFTGIPNPPSEAGQYDQIAVFPDFNTDGRTQDNVIYFDNITFNPSEPITDGPDQPAPTPPERNAEDVISLFSDAYTDVPVDTWRTDWSATNYNEISIEDNPVKKYSNLDFAGIETVNNQIDITDMTHFHMNVWSDDFTFLSVKLVDFGPNGVYDGGDDTEHQVEFNMPEQGTWITLDIPLSELTGLTTRQNIAQLILVGKPTGETTVYVDNVYFYKAGEVSDGPNAPIDFETDGYGANWTWSVFENATNPPLEIIANPDAVGINTSTTVAKFTALQAGNPWAGVESAHGDANLGPFVLDATNSVIKIMVWKPVISNVGIKLVAASGWAQPEIKVANTVVNEWEELTFDFSGIPNPPSEEGQYDQIAVFPDFNTDGRTQDNVIYFDNITFNPSEPIAEGPDQPAPTPPERNADDVISLFSDAYTDVPVDTWRTDWSATTYSEISIEDNPVKKYANLDFAGIETVNNQIDITDMTHFHMNVWSDDFTFFAVKLVDFGPNGAYDGGDDTEHQVEFEAPEQGEWVTLDIPLSELTGLTTRENIAQMILVGRPTAQTTVYVDNVYFYKDPQTNVDTPDRLHEAISIFPNPVSSGNRVQLSSIADRVEVIDLMGRLIISTVNTSVIQTDHMHKGIYFVRIHTKQDGTQTHKLIVN